MEETVGSVKPCASLRSVLHQLAVFGGVGNLEFLQVPGVIYRGSLEFSQVPGPQVIYIGGKIKIPSSPTAYMVYFLKSQSLGGSSGSEF